MNETEDLIPLQDMAMATSGDLFQFVEIDGKRYSHILNPSTGMGLTTRSLVAILKLAFFGMFGEQMEKFNSRQPSSSDDSYSDHLPKHLLIKFWVETHYKLRSYSPCRSS